MKYTELLKVLSEDNYVIVSGQTLEQDLTSLLEELLIELNANYVKLEGTYKGEKEVSFLIRDYSYVLGHGLAKEFDQESFIVARKGKAELIFTATPENGHKFSKIRLLGEETPEYYSEYQGFKFTFE